MGLFTSINTATSGMTAQRMRLDVISDNIANAETTRTPEGGAFRRSRVIFKPEEAQPYWKSPFLPEKLQNGIGRGVEVVEIEKDLDSEMRLVYDPTHPDAMKAGPKAGYVEMPNVNIVDEMVDMISASRSYEANVAVVEGSKSMFMKALEIGRR
jgi:flagellar basal-body rod protein FlgC